MNDTMLAVADRCSDHQLNDNDLDMADIGNRPYSWSPEFVR